MEVPSRLKPTTSTLGTVPAAEEAAASACTPALRMYWCTLVLAHNVTSTCNTCMCVHVARVRIRLGQSGLGSCSGIILLQAVGLECVAFP